MCSLGGQAGSDAVHLLGLRTAYGSALRMPMSPVRLHGKVFTVVEMNASRVAAMAIASSNERMIAGVAAASVSLGVAQLASIPFGARADARTAIASSVVDLTPGPSKSGRFRLWARWTNSSWPSSCSW